MHEFVSFNGELVSADAANISAASPAALYGKGVFTTLAINGGLPLLFEKHWRRLKNDASKLQIDLADLSELTVERDLGSLIRANSLAHGKARITFFDRSAGTRWKATSASKTAVLIMTGDRRIAGTALRIGVSPYRVFSSSPLAGVKSCNYLENILAIDDAVRNGLDEAIRLNERGEITSACMANVFWTKNGRCFTPSLRTGCLPGTVREFVIENIDCEEVAASAEALTDTDGIFLTSSGIGVAAASEFNGVKLPRPRHPILELLPFPAQQNTNPHE
jgi:branched-subunit amino acid aminotransferase/4-amino-4-deoxychorismate lyase